MARDSERVWEHIAETQLEDGRVIYDMVPTGPRQETEQEINREEVEKKRITEKLLVPATKFRLERDNSYFSIAGRSKDNGDERMDPNSPKFKPFEEVLQEDWTELVKDYKEEQEGDFNLDELEKDQLTPYTEDQVEDFFRSSINKAKDSDYKNSLREYRDFVFKQMLKYKKNIGEAVYSKTNSKKITKENSPASRFEIKKGNENEELSKRQKEFLKLIRENYQLDFERFLRSGRFGQYCKETRLSNVEAIALVAKEALLKQGKQNEYERFKDFAILPKRDKFNILKKYIRNLANQTEAGLTTRYLYVLIRERTPTENVKEFNPDFGSASSENNEGETKEDLVNEVTGLTNTNEPYDAENNAFGVELQQEEKEEEPTKEAEKAEAVEEPVTVEQVETQQEKIKPEDILKLMAWKQATERAHKDNPNFANFPWLKPILANIIQKYYWENLDILEKNKNFLQAIKEQTQEVPQTVLFSLADEKVIAETINSYKDGDRYLVQGFPSEKPKPVEAKKPELKKQVIVTAHGVYVDDPNKKKESSHGGHGGHGHGAKHGHGGGHGHSSHKPSHSGGGEHKEKKKETIKEPVEILAPPFAGEVLEKYNNAKYASELFKVYEKSGLGLYKLNKKSIDFVIEGNKEKQVLNIERPVREDLAKAVWLMERILLINKVVTEAQLSEFYKTMLADQAKPAPTPPAQEAKPKPVEQNERKENINTTTEDGKEKSGNKKESPVEKLNKKWGNNFYFRLPNDPGEKRSQALKSLNNLFFALNRAEADTVRQALAKTYENRQKNGLYIYFESAGSKPRFEKGQFHLPVDSKPEDLLSALESLGIQKKQQT